MIFLNLLKFYFSLVTVPIITPLAVYSRFGNMMCVFAVFIGSALWVSWPHYCISLVVLATSWALFVYLEPQSTILLQTLFTSKPYSVMVGYNGPLLLERHQKAPKNIKELRRFASTFNEWWGNLFLRYGWGFLRVPTSEWWDGWSTYSNFFTNV